MTTFIPSNNRNGDLPITRQVWQILRREFRWTFNVRCDFGSEWKKWNSH